jgi:hypothetical protein
MSCVSHPSLAKSENPTTRRQRSSTWTQDLYLVRLLKNLTLGVGRSGVRKLLGSAFAVGVLTLDVESGPALSCSGLVVHVAKPSRLKQLWEKAAHSGDPSRDSGALRCEYASSQPIWRCWCRRSKPIASCKLRGGIACVRLRRDMAIGHGRCVRGCPFRLHSLLSDPVF